MASTVKAGLTTSSLLTSIKRRAMVPDNQNTFSDQDFIDFANEEMMISMVPSIMQVKEEYFIFKQVVPLVSEKSNYPIPERALASKVRELCYRDSALDFKVSSLEISNLSIVNGSAIIGGFSSSDLAKVNIGDFVTSQDAGIQDKSLVLSKDTNSITISFNSTETNASISLAFSKYMPYQANEYEMTQIAVDDRYTGLSNGTGSADFTGFRRFYLMGNDIILHPSVGPSASGALSFYYYLRPNNLVKDSAVATITSIDRATGNITLSSIPSGYSVYVSGSNNSVLTTFDFVKAKSAHNILDIDLTINSINSNTKIANIDPHRIPKDLEVGDYFALAGQTCVPNIPTELHTVLAQKVSQRIMEALGDSEGLNNATAKTVEMEQRLSTMLDNRVEGSPRKVVNRALMTGVARNRRR
jgi:hypothetical protein